MISDKESVRIENKYDLLLRACQSFLDDNERKQIDDAFRYALDIHNDRRMEYGELRICHALNIARVAVEEMGLGTASVISCLIHDILLNGFATEEEITRRFGIVISHLVVGFGRISELPTERVSIQSDSFRELFMAIVDDIRIILIKTAHRLYDMRIIEKLPAAKQARFIDEVAHIYIPIAHRFGLYRVKKELEDLSMKYTNSDIYNQIAQKIRDTEAKRKVFIKEFITPIQKELYKQDIQFDITGRPKSIPSIWSKMHKQDVEFEEVYDLFAIRIILESDLKSEKTDSWKVYSIVTNIYSPNPKRLRDWITTPKASGYESLHTTVMGPNKKWVEVQIRSKRMDEIAEKGQAAHWQYKGFGSKKDSGEWLAQVRDILENPDQVNFDKLEPGKIKKKSNKVFVFTPNGDLKELAIGATVLDFAFDVHTNVGYACTGARINNRIAPLRQELSNGDKVEILTSKIQKPKLDWLNYATTTRAKNKIRRALKEERFEEAAKGNEILRRKFRNWKIGFDDSNIDKLIKKYKLSSSVDLYNLIYNEKIDLLEIKRFLTNVDEKSAVPQKETGKDQLQAAPDDRESKMPGDVLMISKDIDKVNYNLAKCCNPIPGDRVFGFVTISRGISIHRLNCPNAKQLLSRFHYRKIDVKWKDTEDASSFQTVVRVTGVDKVGMMTEVSQVISNDLKVNMLSVKIDSSGGTFTGTIKLNVKGTRHLDELLHKLTKIKGVTKAVRIE